MNDPIDPPAAGASKTLWAATLVLVVVVLAMGAALIRIQSQPIEPRLVWVGQHGTAPAAVPVASAAVLPTSATSSAPAAATSYEQNTAQALINKGQYATDSIANKTAEITTKPRPIVPQKPEPAVLRPPAPVASMAADPESGQALPR